ncbi:UDP-2,4-diacetamido-2,4,6-trideoxy-beta-L-altropyranose hydrolase [Francisella adeliensis]|uniref:UDP-2,4-diacetamido-2,4, 6-trideoxy-beta-L-altropyranose hydrolase n=1 Tax=Francisella adeliensis TaxID=2007306 RepID=A0A2Z4XWY7_9GAMM|nr:UDP-2,4-diacetamido-2,4,6-trideoxy-beta-L-altropyranose hydrolase [Francisella adeliensis]AXA33394.1 UDP-2,4-diacetamido-2,4,6-trideoxy-beta-L-altropyranose hydrolase [Francisella adeliensis]MBK2085410.1 UDP-2,4-diacetamido-2,4,6-trideoxy-beta-L-altropyranose hydrolase [Francisella adeliensis]MBK2097140.1 UDP-2,4-diacetamido-2,4,6-trideoxy-beta-L-altropyranose hydrolase [Francisella adeliensis]QIW11622.1 UDP-2,4-diacetamido-2,4,6-trideoxy-beta-L-altropyranose hydrolase [Francisella adeliensi
MNILIRADSSFDIGIGHIMRDLVLAKQYANDNVIFATQDLPHNINHKILESGFTIELLESNKFEKLDILIKKLQIDMIVIDHYGIDYEFERQLKTSNSNLKIFVLDDTYEKHCCDILLNHNISADESKYTGKVPENCELRCGSKYTLLREEFIIEKSKPKIINEKTTIFVAMGGADHSNININILEVLKDFDNTQVDLVTTNANKNLEALKRYCNNKKWINLHINSTEIAKLMKNSDFAIVTPSVTVNEVVFMELPLIAIKTAENQDGIYQYLDSQKYLCLGNYDAVGLKNRVIDVCKTLSL